jgi:Lrp/AsnC family transcriptional regulator, leucine-responsive regulatory protein
MAYSLVAFIFVQTEFRDTRTATLLARLPEVEELHRIAGDDCYVLRVRVSNTEQLERLVRDKIERMRSVHSTRITLVLKTLKDKYARQLKGKSAAASETGSLR